MVQPQDETRITAALYARDSATGDNEDSNPDQLARARAFCQENGITPGEEYVDRNGSREAFDQMTKDGTAENPLFQVIVVSDLNQLVWSPEEKTESVAKMLANGIQIMSVAQGPLDTAQFGETLKKLVDDYQSRVMSDQIKRGLANRDPSDQ